MWVRKCLNKLLNLLICLTLSFNTVKQWPFCSSHTLLLICRLVHPTCEAVARPPTAAPCWVSFCSKRLQPLLMGSRSFLSSLSLHSSFLPDCPACLCTLSPDIRCRENSLSATHRQGPRWVGSDPSNKPRVCVCMYTHVYVYLLISTDKYMCNVQIPPSGSFLWVNSGVEGEMGIKNNF